jgi:hypothetical protein
MLANDLTPLTPVTAVPGPALAFGFPGLAIVALGLLTGEMAWNAVLRAMGVEPVGNIHA